MYAPPPGPYPLKKAFVICVTCLLRFINFCVFLTTLCTGSNRLLLENTSGRYNSVPNLYIYETYCCIYFIII